jgi:hypothetical protein
MHKSHLFSDILTYDHLRNREPPLHKASCVSCAAVHWLAGSGSVVSSWQDFSASPADKFGCWGKNTALLVFLLFWCYLEKKYSVFLCVKKLKICQICPPSERKENKNKLSKGLNPPVGFFVKILAKAWSQISQAFCELAAEQSASWQHCGLVQNRFPLSPSTCLTPASRNTILVRK